MIFLGRILPGMKATLFLVSVEELFGRSEKVDQKLPFAATNMLSLAASYVVNSDIERSPC